MANIFWVGGTGANLAMAYARLIQLGFTKKQDTDKHFIIDTPANLGENFNNIGIKAFEKAGLAIEKLSLADNDYNSFADFLENKKKFKFFYEKFKTHDGNEDAITKANKDGNYYMPALPAAMVLENLTPQLPDLQGNSFICASCYGGTGAGVVPSLARYLAKTQNRQVTILYLNRWIIGSDGKTDIDPIIKANQAANLEYLDWLNHTGVDIKYYLFDVSPDWRKNKQHDNNTEYEEFTPIPYYVAAVLDFLLRPAGGTLIANTSKCVEISLDKKNLNKNPFFIRAYEQKQTFMYKLIDDLFFTGIKENKKNQHWPLHGLFWPPTDTSKPLITYSKQTENSSEKFFDMLGINTKPLNANDLQNATIDIPEVSYPSILASFFYFKRYYKKNPGINLYVVRDAYLALVASVATNQVIRQTWVSPNNTVNPKVLEENYYVADVGVSPVVLRSASGEVLGFSAPTPYFVWPTRAAYETLSEKIGVNGDNQLKGVLAALQSKSDEILQQDNQQLSNVMALIQSWYNAGNQGVKREHNYALSYFKPIDGVPSNKILSRAELSIQWEGDELLFSFEEEEKGEVVKRGRFSIEPQKYSLLFSNNKLTQCIKVETLAQLGNELPWAATEGNHKLALNYQAIIPLDSKYTLEQKAGDSCQGDDKGAYLALVALVALKKVYAHFNNREQRIELIGKVEGINKTYGYADPTPGRFIQVKGDEYRQELTERLQRENYLQAALHNLNGEPAITGQDSYLAKVLTQWCQANPLDNQSLMNRGIPGKQFFIDLRVDEDGQLLGFIENVTHITVLGDNRLELKLDNNPARILRFNCETHKLIPLDTKIYQYTNVKLSESRADNKLDENSHLVLNYHTVFTLPANYQTQIIHPAYLLADKAIEFQKNCDTPYHPWPLRKKEFKDCFSAFINQTAHNTPLTIIGNDYLNMGEVSLHNWGRLDELEPENRTLFQVEIWRPFENNNNAYHAYIWPLDKHTRKFISQWKYYSIFINCRDPQFALKTRLNEEAGLEEIESWHYQADNEWASIEFNETKHWVSSFKINSTKDSLSALFLELTHEGTIYGACFPLPPPISLDQLTWTNQDSPVVSMGLDFGTLGTCVAFMPQDAVHADLHHGTPEPETLKQIQFNPADLCYPVFEANQAWRAGSDQTNPDLDYEWIPTFGIKQTGDASEIIIPSLLSLFKNAPNWYPGQGKAFQNYTIPGESVVSDVFNTAQNKLKTDPALWNNRTKEYLETLFLLIAAQLFLGYKTGLKRYNQIQLIATVPFLYKNQSIKRDNRDISYQDAYAQLLNEVCERVGNLSGQMLRFHPSEMLYESQASLPHNPSSDISIVIDTGSGTTDVAVLNRINGQHQPVTISSFAFAGRNPFGAKVGGNATTSYITRQYFLTGLNGAKDAEVDNFIYLMSAYAGLLVAAAYLQFKENQGAEKEIESPSITLYLQGQGWHLAKFHHEVQMTQADTRDHRSLIKKQICDIFNQCIKKNEPRLEAEEFKLTESNIDIRKDSTQAKWACAIGMLKNPAGLLVINNAFGFAPTFLGVASCSSEKIAWYQTASDSFVAGVDDFDIKQISPKLLLNEKAYKEASEAENAPRMQAATLNDAMQVKRNVLEYLLATIIGGTGKEIPGIDADKINKECKKGLEKQKNDKSAENMNHKTSNSNMGVS